MRQKKFTFFSQNINNCIKDYLSVKFQEIITMNLMLIFAIVSQEYMYQEQRSDIDMCIILVKYLYFWSHTLDLYFSVSYAFISFHVVFISLDVDILAVYTSFVKL
ncbi:hypothetical protein HS088_TW07G01105 [Tripterygium wilfordii]|uniref:Uncharacterized protein n=1 Tax=Tripterygium wilfordii TaxID=458696 RepID=A0A7J7DGK9_TRIWF|nr:hypothetical protein HS088_TW07G01105 [Tripterygium wilfordii]